MTRTTSFLNPQIGVLNTPQSLPAIHHIMASFLLVYTLMKSAAVKVKFSTQSKTFTDVVGLELGAGCSLGVPAVRLRKREGKTELVAAGFLALPGELPQKPDDADKVAVWSLPRPFQAPHAALAITSPLTFLRHVSGGDDDAVENKQFAYRTASRMLAPEMPPLSVGIPEFQAAWAARLLPEGRPPTACSLQVSPAAAINTFMTSTLFESLSETAVVLFVFPSHTSLVAFHESRLILYREHPVGHNHICEAIGSQMHIERDLVDSILDDSVIDPTPMIEPILRSLFRQVEISYDYLTRRRNCKTQNFFVCGLPSGTKYWTSMFSSMLNLTLTPFQPFEGIEQAPRATNIPENLSAVAPFLMTALGAARAVLEDT